MSQTKEQAAAMIAYLFQIMFERGEKLRHQEGSKESERNAGIIHALARSISILREDYGLYDRVIADAQPQPDDADAQPEQPQAEPAQYDQEREAPEEELTA